MKKFGMLLFLAALFLMTPSDVNAQIRVNININSQPQWGPDEYDYVEYYYLPEVGIYYYAPKAQFIYLKGNRWIYSYDLPYKYRHVNLYNTYKVVINEPRPYLRHKYYVSHYRGYKNNHSKQGNIRDSKNPRYRHANTPQGHSRDNVGNRPQNRKVQSKSDVRGRQDNHGTMNNNRGKGQDSHNNQKSQGDRGSKGDKGHGNDRK